MMAEEIVERIVERRGRAATFAGVRAVVVGYGTSGRAAARALAGRGASVVVSEARDAADLLDADPPGDPGSLSGAVELRAGGHRPEHLDGADLVVVSPGVPPTAPVVGWARERGLPVWGELELGARIARAPYLAVTGTNGKSTTVELLAEILRAAGLRARACGNVGYPFPEAAGEDLDALVVEASSFQLAFHETFRPRVSVLLNVAPDHLDWHGSFEAYAGAKARVHAAQGEGDVHVGNAEDAGAAAISREAPCEVRWFRAGPPLEGEVGVEDGAVVARIDGRRLPLGSPNLAGALLADAAAAAAAALAFGVDAAAIGAGLASFRALPHRGEEVARAGIVRFLDDSKATNVHAALAALAGRRQTVLIAGGLAKGVELSALADAAPSLAAVVAIGEAAAALEEAFDGRGVVVRRAGSMEEAVEAAWEEAHPGEVVLLAPACASMDMFRDYADRGERFAAAARDLAAVVNAGGDPALGPGG